MLSVVFLFSGAYAQDESTEDDNQGGLTSKKGETILPEAGDWAIGFDAAPFLQYAGRFLGTGNVAPTANFATSDASIIGKYFVDAQTAYRARLRIGTGSSNSSTLTDTSLAANGGQGLPEYQGNYIEDITTTKYHQVTIGGGLEKRKGNTRIQGFYGGEAMVTFGGSKTTTDYGLDMAATTVQYSNVGTSRTVETSGGNMFGFGVRGFIGAEIFIFPKVSVAAEYGWGFGWSTTAEKMTKSENWQLANSTATAPSLVETEVKTAGKTSGWGVDTDNSGGQLNIIFHF